jgi:hypothetical protein
MLKKLCSGLGKFTSVFGIDGTFRGSDLLPHPDASFRHPNAQIGLPQEEGIELLRLCIKMRAL